MKTLATEIAKRKAQEEKKRLAPVGE